MKLFDSRYILPWIFVVLAFVGVSSGAKTLKTDQTDRAKAEYMFMEGAARLSDGDYGTAYYMLRRAAELDPSDDAIAAGLGKLTLQYGLGDSAELERGYAAMKRLFFNNPADDQNGYEFIVVAEHFNRAGDAKAAYEALMEAHPGNADYALSYAGYRTLDFLKGDSTGPAEAAAIYDRLEDGVGVTDILTLHRLRSLSVTADSAEMLRQIGRFHATAPLDPEVNYLTGSMYNLIHVPDSAIIYYTAACLLDSTYGPAYLAKAEHYLQVGDSARYDIEVIRALESPSLEFESKYEILSGYAQKMYMDIDRRSTFLGLFRRMLDIHPGESSLHYLYGLYLGSIDSVAAASEQFGYAMDLDPEEELFARYRLQTAVESGDSAAAVATAKAAMERFPHIYYPVTGASILQLEGKPKEAVEFLRSYDINRAENDYQKSIYEQSLGDALYAAEQKDSAFAAYDRSLEYNPDNAGVLNNVAYFLSVDGVDLDKAERYVKRALLYDAENPTYIDTYAWVLFKQKDYPAAKRQIDRALDIYRKYEPDDSVYASSGDTVFVEVLNDELVEMVTGIEDGAMKAREDAEAALVVEEMEAEDIPVATSEIYDHAGDIYFMNGEPDLALNFWKEALALDPENEKIKKKVKNKAYFFD